MEYLVAVLAVCTYVISILITMMIGRKYGKMPKGVTYKQFINSNNNAEQKKLLKFSKAFIRISSFLAITFFILVIIKWLMK